MAVSKQILVVDDDDDVRALTTMSLSRVGGHQVVAVGSGAEALAALAEDTYDLVVLDVLMPGMSGIQVLASIRSNPATVDVDVILLTASVSHEETVRMNALPVAAVISKPFDVMALPVQVDRAVGW